MDTTKRPGNEQKSRDELLLEIQEMKSIMMKYCTTTSTLEETDVDADDTAELHKNLTDLKKNTEDLKSMSEDLVCKQRQAYAELTHALERMTQVANKYGSGNQASFSDEDFEYAVDLAEEQKAEIEALKRDKKDLKVELKELKEIVDYSMGQSSTISTYRRKGGCYKEFKKKIDKLNKKLKEKEVELEHMNALTHVLISKERSLNDELQEACKELIRGMGDECNRSVVIGLKRMGELDPRPFAVFDDMLPENDGGKKRKENDGGKGCSHTKDYCEITESVQLCSFWESNLRDQTWHPFETIEVHGNKEKVINEDDPLLKSVKNEFGEEVYKAITTAATELNEYNPSGLQPVQEIWNYKEKRKATTKEAISLLLKQLKASKQLKATRRSAR